MSIQPQRLVAALDLGSTKVVAVIAEVTGDARDPGAKILGLGVERSGGIRRGVVRDIEETTRAIDKAMKSAQRMAGVQVGSVYCGIAGMLNLLVMFDVLLRITGSSREMPGKQGGKVATAEGVK